MKLPAPVEGMTHCGPWLKKPEDIKDMPCFPAEFSKSSVAKFLTKEDWELYKDSSDSAGVSFKRCILSGCQNVDSGIGCYAGSHDSYKSFNQFFDKIVQDYHGHAPDAQHVSNMNAESLIAPALEGDEAAMIVSTRIRVGRNLAAFPLGPGITNEQRMEIMKQVTTACETFEGDLKGTFYDLASMSAAAQKQLIEDHFLFKEGDRFLEACGLNRDWPKGRGIFHNDAKTFLVWVNEEDQLRIISMQQGADIHAVFESLSRAAAHIETVCKFAHDDHLGYITSCPTNLGTALRASVHIKLPKLSKDMPKFQAIADKYHVQIRGTHGEHTETNDGTYDISNKRRLGFGEVELVQDMYNGIIEMIKEEKAL